MKVAGGIVVLVLAPLLVMAVHGSSPWLAKKLLRQAARRLPEPFGDRYEEEWLAELDAMPDGGLANLAFAFCIRLRVGSMNRTLSTPSLSRSTQMTPESEASPTTVVEPKRISAYRDLDGSIVVTNHYEHDLTVADVRIYEGKDFSIRKLTELMPNPEDTELIVDDGVVHVQPRRRTVSRSRRKRR